MSSIESFFHLRIFLSHEKPMEGSRGGVLKDPAEPRSTVCGFPKQRKRFTLTGGRQKPRGLPPCRMPRKFRRNAAESHLPPITLHGLRHSFASVANSQGVPMYDISKALGHSSISVTSNIYTHLFDETESRTLQAVAQAIRP